MWRNATLTTQTKRGTWKNYVPLSSLEESFFIPKFNIHIKANFLYQVYLVTNDMKMSAFKRCVYRCLEVRDFRNWRTRFAWIGRNYKSHAQTLTRMQMYYGESEGMQKWKQYLEKQAITNSYEYKHVKYGMSREEYVRYNKSRAVTLNNMIARHGYEDGRKKYAAYVERQRYAGCSLEYFIEKYGKEEGQRKYDAMLMSKANSCQSHSKTADDFFHELADIIKPVRSQYSLNGGEKRMKIDTGYIYIDFYLPDSNIAIEFFGDYWHGNPRKYNKDSILYEGMTAEQIWMKDDERISALRKHGIQCLIIWEHDVINKRHEVMQQCLEWIKTSQNQI